MTPVMCFDLETVPDVDALRATLGIGADVPDAEVAERAFELRREKTGSDFLPLHQHRIVAIGCLLRDDKGLRVRCLGEPGDPEATLVHQFFRMIEHYSPQLVSWNGSGFDLPVLHYRALRHGIAAPRYWEMGEDDRDFRWNNYISRYHARHLDLMDLLALYNLRAAAPLDDIARLCGFPGKVGMDGAQVWPAWRDGKIEQIRGYCETDVANTWLVYCRFQQFRGGWTEQAAEREIEALRTAISAEPPPHWQEFLAAWRG